MDANPATDCLDMPNYCPFGQAEFACGAFGAEFVDAIEFEDAIGGGVELRDDGAGAFGDGHIGFFWLGRELCEEFAGSADRMKRAVVGEADGGFEGE